MAHCLIKTKGINPKVIVHKLNMKKKAKLMKEKKRSFTLERQEMIKEEVKKLIGTSFINEFIYLDWLMNMVLV